MDKGQIEKAAREYAEGITYNQDRKRNCHTDFIAGADWAMEYLAHIPFDELITEIADYLKGKEGTK